jgi:hypothetical protein
MLSIYAVKLPRAKASICISLMIIVANKGSIAKDFHGYLLEQPQFSFRYLGWNISLRQGAPVSSLAQVVTCLSVSFIGISGRGLKSAFPVALPPHHSAIDFIVSFRIFFYHLR